MRVVPWEVVEAEAPTGFSPRAPFSDDYSALFRRGRVGAAIFVRVGQGWTNQVQDEPIGPRWASQEFLPTTSGMKSRERFSAPPGGCKLVLPVATFSGMCTWEAGAGVDRGMIHTFRGRWGIEREGEGKLPGFPTALYFLAPVNFCISALSFSKMPL